MKILFTPFHEGGHVHSMIGLAKKLQSRGHEVIFFVDKTKEDLMAENGLNMEVLDIGNSNKIIELFRENQLAPMKLPSISINFFNELYQFLSGIMYRMLGGYKLIQFIIYEDKQLKALIERVKPDVIMVDNWIRQPSILCSGKPWIYFLSQNPYWFANGKDVPLERLGQLILGIKFENFIIN